MSSVETNRKFYQSYDWSRGGEEWADAWGGSDMQWYATILPRIHNFLPANRIVEIGAGCGRWVPFLEKYCDELILVDIATDCIEHLSQRFENSPAIRTLLGDGTSACEIESNSVDFVFSFHSLVHADIPTMRGYIGELERILTVDGVAFIHHSNAAAYAHRSDLDIKLLEDFRDITVSGDLVAAIASEKELLCVSREEVNWETDEPFDCFTVLARPTSLLARSETSIRNVNFRKEMAYWGQLAQIYAKAQTQAIKPWKHNLRTQE